MTGFVSFCHQQVNFCLLKKKKSTGVSSESETKNFPLNFVHNEIIKHIVCDCEKLKITFMPFNGKMVESVTVYLCNCEEVKETKISPYFLVWKDF